MNNLYKKVMNSYIRRKNNKAFLKICNTGDYQQIDTFLNNTPSDLLDINTYDYYYNNGYLLACQGGCIETLKRLEARHINIEQINSNGQNAFLVAISHGNLDILKYLMVKININKLDVEGNNVYILASKTGKIDVMKFLERETEINKLHTNFNGYNAYTIHRDLCTCPEKTKEYENMRISVMHLARNGYPVSFLTQRKYLADIYYQLYYLLKPSYYCASKLDNIKCNICLTKLYTTQAVIKCSHNHTSHVKCFINKSCKKICDRYSGYNHYSYPDISDSCIQCNEPYIMKQENVRIILIE